MLLVIDSQQTFESLVPSQTDYTFMESVELIKGFNSDCFFLNLPLCTYLPAQSLSVTCWFRILDTTTVPLTIQFKLSCPARPYNPNIQFKLICPASPYTHENTVQVELSCKSIYPWQYSSSWAVLQVHLPLTIQFKFELGCKYLLSSDIAVSKIELPCQPLWL